jgi:hypothetical protein
VDGPSYSSFSRNLIVARASSWRELADPHVETRPVLRERRPARSLSEVVREDRVLAERGGAFVRAAPAKPRTIGGSVLCSSLSVDALEVPFSPAAARKSFTASTISAGQREP